MELDQIVQLQNQRLERLEHAVKASGYLKHQAEALGLLGDLASDNGTGCYTYAMQMLIAYVIRLRSDAAHHVYKAQGKYDDDIPL